ncbi:MAG: hypothetical protein DRJ28_09375 [Actinobacteria bacterium]|nr:MAG: hypothetical protein DRJ28_09375 [Actinomycetota bacterium]
MAAGILVRARLHRAADVDRVGLSREVLVKRLCWVFVLAVVVSACGGGSSDSVGTPDDSGVVVESADGLAILSFSERSLPDGTSPDDVHLAVAFNEGADDGFPVMGVQLVPHGLVLTEPATLTIRLPAALDDGFMVIHQSGNFVEFLDGEVARDDESLLFTTSIEHFSLVYIHHGVVDGSITLAPNPVTPDQVQEAEIAVTVKDPVSLVIGESACEDGCHGADFTLYKFSVSPISFRDSETAWGEAPASLANWDPAARESEVIEAADHWESFASSMCLKPNTSQVSTATAVIYRLTLLGSSEPRDVEFLAFAEALGEEVLDSELGPIDIQRNEGDPASFNIDTLQDGDTFRAVSFSKASAEAVCTDDPPETEVPPGLDPRAHVVGVEPVVTANGTQGIIVIPAQPWTGLPVIRSFYIGVGFIVGDCSGEASVETHEGTVNAPGPWRLLDDGSSFVDTGCDINPGAPIDITIRSGSWQDGEGNEAVFWDRAFTIDPDAVANAPGPFDMSRVVENLGAPPVPLELVGFRITGASNDGNGKITVDFKGPVKDLVEGDEHIVEIWIDASEDDITAEKGISVGVSLRNINGELVPNGSTMNQADAVNGVIYGVPVDTVWEWTADNQLGVTMVSTEGVPIPSTVPSVTVTVKQAGSTDEYTFTR